MAEEETEKTGEEVKPPDNESAPPQAPQDSHHECKSMIAGLSDRINDLENTVKAVIQIKPDSSPVKKPWTHRRF